MYSGNIRNFQTIRMISVKNRLISIVSLPDEYVNELQLYRESFKLGCMLDHSVYDMIYLVTGKTQYLLCTILRLRLRFAQNDKGGFSGKTSEIIIY